MARKEKKNIHYVNKIEEMSAEDIRAQQRGVKKLVMPEIDTLDYLYDAIETTYQYPELTALCPMTGIQDLYTLRITYVPGKKIPELKSLRMYLLAYRDVPIFHEHLINKIFEDFAKTVNPLQLTIELDVAIRGGIHTTITKKMKKERCDEK